jgi:hypothetical protein
VVSIRGFFIEEFVVGGVFWAPDGLVGITVVAFGGGMGRAVEEVFGVFVCRGFVVEVGFIVEVAVDWSVAWGFDRDGWFGFDCVVAFGGGVANVVELIGSLVCGGFIVAVVAFGKEFVRDGWILVIGGFNFVLTFEGIGFSAAFGGGFVDWKVNIESFAFIAHKGFAIAETIVMAGGSVVGGLVFVSVLGGVIVGVVAFGSGFVGREVFIGSGNYILGGFIVVVVVAFRVDVVGGCVVVVVGVCITLHVIFFCDRAFNRPLRTKTVVLGSWCTSIQRTVILALAIMFISHMGCFRACGGTVMVIALRSAGRVRCVGVLVWGSAVSWFPFGEITVV